MSLLWQLIQPALSDQVLVFRLHFGVAVGTKEIEEAVLDSLNDPCLLIKR